MSTQAIESLDLDACAREPIHTPGAVQGHVDLVVLNMQAEVLAASEGSDALFGRELVGLSDLRSVAGPAVSAAIDACLGARLDDLRENPQLVLAASSSPIERDVIAHVQGERLLLEFETPSTIAPPELDATNHAMRAIAAAADVQTLCEVVVSTVRAMTGFDRVMVYQFDADYHGWVRAESQVGGYEPFLGLHYPASDIPAQARALFLANRTRVLVDRDAARRELRSTADEAIDLTHARSRAVSPIHLEYLANMGVQASLNIALESRGRLWGLIACHHYAGSRHLSYDARAACEVLAHLVSLRIRVLESDASDVLERELSERHGAALRMLAKAETLEDGVRASRDELASQFDASGFTMIIRGEAKREGATLDTEALLQHLESSGESVQIVESLEAEGLERPTDPAGGEPPAGYLAVRVPHAPMSWLVWYRPEQAREVRWGGDPSKKVHVSKDGRVSPRKSFAAWKEQVRGRSAPWTARERRAAERLNASLSDVVFREKQRVQRLRQELSLRNREVETFATMASHDLREPLRGIGNYATFLREDAAHMLDADATQHLDRIDRLVRRMYGLIEGMLALSRVGRVKAVRYGAVDLRAVVDQVLVDHAPLLEETGAQVLVSELPSVETWEVGVRTVFANLITNAIRYSDAPPRVEIGTAKAGAIEGAPADVDETARVFYVRDAGIGIADEHHEQIFRIFHRLHAGMNYGESTGAGLAIVRKVIELMGGHIWLRSALGAGSTFAFTLPLMAELSS
ncbi:MAG: ATP-binding protein [Myxococcota bacterium]